MSTKTNDMKITAKQIEKGMKIRIVGVQDNSKKYAEYSVHPNFKSEHDKYKFLIENGLTKSVSAGGIRKSSPIVTVEKIEFADSMSYRMNGRKVTLNSIYLHTELGILEIGNRQKVELL